MGEFLQASGLFNVDELVEYINNQIKWSGKQVFPAAVTRQQIASRVSKIALEMGLIRYGAWYQQSTVRAFASVARSNTP
jgi:hypothetical protein